MTLDNEQQREVLLQLINSATFPGSALDVVFELKQAVVKADIDE